MSYDQNDFGFVFSDFNLVGRDHSIYTKRLRVAEILDPENSRILTFDKMDFWLLFQISSEIKCLNKMTRKENSEKAKAN